MRGCAVSHPAPKSVAEPGLRQTLLKSTAPHQDQNPERTTGSASAIV